MVKHIVMWKLLEHAEGNCKQENINIIKERLQGLKAKIPQIRYLEVGVNKNPDGYDAVLYTEFDSFDDLNIYQNHPDHKAVSVLVSKIRSDRVVCDYIA